MKRPTQGKEGLTITCLHFIPKMIFLGYTCWHLVVKVCFIYFYFFKSLCTSQDNWCNMTFTAGNLFSSHSCIGWPESNPQQDSNPGPQLEKWTTYQLSYPSLLVKVCTTITTVSMAVLCTYSHKSWIFVLFQFARYIISESAWCVWRGDGTWPDCVPRCHI